MTDEKELYTLPAKLAVIVGDGVPNSFFDFELRGKNKRPTAQPENGATWDHDVVWPDVTSALIESFVKEATKLSAGDRKWALKMLDWAKVEIEEMTEGAE